MPDDHENPRQPLLDLSLPQLVAGATAAATSAVLINRMGLRSEEHTSELQSH